MIKVLKFIGHFVFLSIIASAVLYLCNIVIEWQTQIGLVTTMTAGYLLWMLGERMLFGS